MTRLSAGSQFAQRANRGFTLLELIMVIVITGIIFGVVTVFIARPVKGYFDLNRRAELSDTADLALRRLTRDLRLALPNSVRVNGNYLEFLITSGGGRYRAAPDQTGAGNILDFSTPAGDTSFDVIGPAPTLAAGNQIVIFNLGSGFGTADAYQAATNNRADFASVSGSTITLSAAKLFPLESPGRRFHVVETPVTYECNVATGQLRRYSGYAIAAAQPTPPAGGTSAALATNVSACSFTYNPNVVAQRYGVVSIQLGLTRDGETVNLQAQAHVANIP